MNPPESTPAGADESLTGRVDALATWVNEIETRLRAAELATGDEKTAKELRKAIEALSKHDPKLEKRVTDHVTVVTQRFETLANTVATTAAALAAREGEIAGLRRELEGAERRIAKLASQAGGADAKELARLRGIVDALSAQRPARTPDSQVDELGAKVRMLAERVDSLTTTVSANAAAVGRRESELAGIRERIDAGAQKIEAVAAEVRNLDYDRSLAQRLDALQLALVEANGAIADREQEAGRLRARIDEAYSRVGDVVTELQRSVGELATQVASLATLPRTTASALEQRAAALDGRIDAVAERLDGVVADVERALAGAEQRDGQLAGLYRDVEADRTRVDGILEELRDALDTLPDPTAHHAEVEARLETLREGVVAVTSRLQEVEGTLASRAEAETSRAGRLDHTLTELAGRLDAGERERAEAAERLRRADEIWLQERDWVRRQLERLAEVQEETSREAGAATPALDELRARLGALETERGSLADQLNELAAAVAERTRSGEADPEAELAALAARLEEVERRGTVVASELAHSTGMWASDLAALGERLDRVDQGTREDAAARVDVTDRLLGALTERLEALERDAGSAQPDDAVAARVDELAVRLVRAESAAQSAAAAAAVAASTPPDETIAEIRALLNRVVGRVESIEERSASAAESELASVVGELGRRLEAVEQATAPVASDDFDSATGEGRFRLELRSLELRMEHAEAAARENREAVLTQLERLASRVEWRLQRLEEAAQEESYVQPEETGAQVVPIRGGADTQ